MAAQSPRSDEAREVQSVAEFYAQVDAVLKKAFPSSRAIWIRAEIQKVTEARSGHCYVELVDSVGKGDKKPVLTVNIWQSTWRPLKRQLSEEGITLENGMVVLVRGSLNFYAMNGSLSLSLQELDVTALLGQIAKRRAELIAALDREGLLARQKALRVSHPPLRLGLVASPGTEGYNDFFTQLNDSRFSFRVVHVATAVQGASAPNEVARAIGALSELGPGALDVVCVVRGGGSKGDLAAFDSEAIARAIANCTVPVWTGIGHTGDQSVADLVANSASITPTQCGQAVVALVEGFYRRTVLDPARSIVRASNERVSSLRVAIDARSRNLSRQASNVLSHARRNLVATAARLGPGASMAIAREGERLIARKRLLAAYDVERQLARGYSLTLDEHGRAIRSYADVSIGSTIVTKVADATLRSVVDTIERTKEA